MGKNLKFFFWVLLLSIWLPGNILVFAMSFEKIWKGLATRFWQVSFEIFF